MKSLKNIRSNPVRLGIPIGLSLCLWIYFAIKTLTISNAYFQSPPEAWPALIVGVLGLLVWVCFCFSDLTEPRFWFPSGTHHPSWESLIPCALVMVSTVATNGLRFLPGIQGAVAALMFSALIMFALDIYLHATRKKPSEDTRSMSKDKEEFGD